MSDNTVWESYADLVIKTGINLAKGQKLAIMTGHDQYWFARLLGQRAYAQGAGFVAISVDDNYLSRARIDNQSKEELSYVPEYRVQTSFEQLADDWARIRVANTSENAVLEGVDAEKLQAMTKAVRSKLTLQMQALMRDKHRWCVCAAPDEVWAKEVLGPDGSLEEFEALFKKLLRLDQGDPIARWDEHISSLLTRCELLNSWRLEKIKITGKGTDAVVALTERSLWKGGASFGPDGTRFGANLPTEEVYTTPHRLGTEGRFSIHRPVTVMGNLVEGAWFTFKQGKVVDFGATKGEATLKKYLEVDDGASFLGELALVDKGSPIFQSGKIFNNILFDENAACHIALGGGYPSCLSNADELKNNEELRAVGCNTSLVHTDFMFGFEDTTIVGVGFDGTEHPIMENGSFVI